MFPHKIAHFVEISVAAYKSAKSVAAQPVEYVFAQVQVFCEGTTDKSTNHAAAPAAAYYDKVIVPAANELFALV